MRAPAMRFLAAALLLAFSSGAGTQESPDPQIERTASAVAAQLRCPLCQGVSIQDSPSELAQEMKDVIRHQLAAGRTPEQVKAYFVERYGEWVLLEPEPRGLNLLVYLLPLLGLVLGTGLVVRTVRRSVPVTS